MYHKLEPSDVFKTLASKKKNFLLKPDNLNHSTTATADSGRNK